MFKWDTYEIYWHLFKYKLVSYEKFVDLTKFIKNFIIQKFLSWYQLKTVSDLTKVSKFTIVSLNSKWFNKSKIFKVCNCKNDQGTEWVCEWVSKWLSE